MLKPNSIALFFILLFFSSFACAEEDTTSITTEAPSELLVSQESLASLSGQLSEKQLNALKEKLVGQAFTALDLSVLKKKPKKTRRKKEEEETEAVFTEEEFAKISDSISLYFNTLTKIQQTTPLLATINELRTKIKKLESGIDELRKEEQEATKKEHDKLKLALKQHTKKVTSIAGEFDFESINFAKLPAMLADLGYEDTLYDVVHEELSEYIGLLRKVGTAKSIIQSLKEVSSSVKKAEKILRAAKTEEEKTTIAEQLRKLSQRKKSLSNNFTLTATGIDPSTLDERSGKKLNVEEEMTKVFSPLIVGLTEFTEPSRRIEFLRSTITYHEQHLPTIRHGIEQVDTLLAETKDKQVSAKLRSEKEYWQQQEKELKDKLAVARQQLIELQNKKLSPSEAFDSFAQAVFSKRGLNIIFSVLIFFASIVALLLLRRLIFIINPFSYIPKLRFISSLIDVVLYILTFLIATIAMIVSLYVAGEILALAIVVVIFLGMIWTVRNTLPMFAEQIKLLLGYGPVRQGERVIHDGIAWLVTSIGIYSYLKNPLLTGGVLRLPIKDLITMRSRIYAEKETWFPCEEGNYILINKSIWRQVLQQTPQRVTFDNFGMKESMPTSEFLQQKILNLSKTPFWAGINLSVAYHHRAILLEKVIPQLAAFVEKEIRELPFGNDLITPWVDFGGMTDTSLDIMVWAKLSPESAPSYNSINLNLRRICLKAANKYGWEIIRFHAIQQRPGTLLDEQGMENNMELTNEPTE